MNRAAAYELLVRELDYYRALSYSELACLVGQTFACRQRSEDADEFDLDVAVSWSNQGAGKILVSGTVGPVAWGSPANRIDEHFVVASPQLPTRVE